MEMANNNDEKKSRIQSYTDFFKEKFNLDEDRASQQEVIENISKGVEFKGTNLWVLIFATFVASLGLNVNSAAVIIGAMLISPLMGPIMGIGLSLGINNFELMKRSLRNFGFMVLVSIITSTIFFTVSPMSNVQSELLARTMPTTYDVLIAFFGGMAGIVAQSRKDRTSTVIPGVAIATALMPPLCTAGYGLATGQFAYFIGAFYLFFINTVFIAFATYFIVRFLKYDKKEFLDKKREARVKRYMAIIMIIAFVPSVVLGYRIVTRSIFESNADRYIGNMFQFEKTKVIDYKKEFKVSGDTSRIEVVLMGEGLSGDAIDNLKAQMLNYGLYRTDLVLRQSDGSDTRLDFSSMQLNYTALLEEKNRQITDLKQRVGKLSADTIDVTDISKEIALVVDNVAAVALSKMFEYDTNGAVQDTALVCMVRRIDVSKQIDQKRLAAWLSVRTKIRNVRIYQNKDGL